MWISAVTSLLPGGFDIINLETIPENCTVIILTGAVRYPHPRASKSGWGYLIATVPKRPWFKEAYPKMNIITNNFPELHDQ